MPSRPPEQPSLPPCFLQRSFTVQQFRPKGPAGLRWRAVVLRGRSSRGGGPGVCQPRTGAALSQDLPDYRHRQDDKHGVGGPAAHLSPRVHLADIHRGTVTNAVALAALTADNVKIPINSYCANCSGDSHSFSKLMPRLSDWVQPASRYQFRMARARRAPTVMIRRRRSMFSRFLNIYAPDCRRLKPANVAIYVSFHPFGTKRRNVA